MPDDNTKNASTNDTTLISSINTLSDVINSLVNKTVNIDNKELITLIKDGFNSIGSDVRNAFYDAYLDANDDIEDKKNISEEHRLMLEQHNSIVNTNKEQSEFFAEMHKVRKATPQEQLLNTAQEQLSLLKQIDSIQSAILKGKDNRTFGDKVGDALGYRKIIDWFKNSDIRKEEKTKENIAKKVNKSEEELKRAEASYRIEKYKHPENTEKLIKLEKIYKEKETKVIQQGTQLMPFATPIYSLFDKKNIDNENRGDIKTRISPELNNEKKYNNETSTLTGILYTINNINKNLTLHDIRYNERLIPTVENIHKIISNNENKDPSIFRTIFSKLGSSLNPLREMSGKPDDSDNGNKTTTNFIKNALIGILSTIDSINRNLTLQTIRHNERLIPTVEDMYKIMLNNEKNTPSIFSTLFSKLSSLLNPLRGMSGLIKNVGAGVMRIGSTVIRGIAPALTAAAPVLLPLLGAAVVGALAGWGVSKLIEKYYGSKIDNKEKETQTQLLEGRTTQNRIDKIKDNVSNKELEQIYNARRSFYAIENEKTNFSDTWDDKKEQDYIKKQKELELLLKNAESAITNKKTSPTDVNGNVLKDPDLKHKTFYSSTENNKKELPISKLDSPNSIDKYTIQFMAKENATALVNALVNSEDYKNIGMNNALYSGTSVKNALVG